MRSTSMLQLVICFGLATSQPSSRPAQEMYRKDLTDKQRVILLREDLLVQGRSMRFFNLYLVDATHGTRKLLWRDRVSPTEGIKDEPELLDVSVEGDNTIVLFNRLRKCWCVVVLNMEGDSPILLPTTNWKPLRYRVAAAGKINGSFQERTLRATISNEGDESVTYELRMRNEREGEWVPAK